MAGGSLLKNNLFGIIILIVALFFYTAGIYANWLWFDSVQYLSVYKKILFSQVTVGVGVAVLFFVVLMINVLIAKRSAKQFPFPLFLSVSFALSLVAGLLSSSYWFTVMRYFNASTFGFVDPVFNKDIGFYTFILPFHEFIVTIGLFLLLFTLGITAAGYLFSGKTKKTVRVDNIQNITADQVVQQVKFEISKQGKTHCMILAGLFLLCISALFYLKRYGVLFSQRGAVYGAGYTDVNIMLPLYTLIAAGAALVGIICFLYIYLQNTKLVTAGGFLLLILFFGGMVISGATQALYVEPNEFNLEKQYIEQNIKHTLFAYNLHDVKTRDFSVVYNLSKADIENNEGTISNVRLWDWRPLLQTYRQIQLFRTYYEFADVDVDRYMINGKLRQLMISPRELDQSQLDEKAKTWVNEKFVFTHGYGAVVSPVNVVTSEGLPDLIVQDIPPKSSVENLELDQPQIYFGEKTDDFVIVNTETEEFDYPLGNENVFRSYTGSDGIALDGFLKKALFAVKLGSLNLLISGSLTEESKVLFNRNIKERVATIAPFLEFDSDPYVIISQGKMYWMIDAYTVTDKFPYSERLGNFNYIRNSVKVVIDAYNGHVDFYVVDPNDPLIENYGKIFNGLFKPLADMPEDLKDHMRYPEDLMRVQSKMYGTYHMKDPQVFYNKEDVWRTPNEIYSSNQVELRPYHIVLKLPGAEEEGFYLINPMVPQGKENLIGWFSAHSDPDSYGQLEVFELSKQELTYGPMQIEARIDQSTEISQLLTLWDQQGSEVIRGNLLVIPIENSFLYIEPVYLRASSGGALPQLKRVIVAYEDQVLMEESLDIALNKIFGTSVQQRVKTQSETPRVLAQTTEEQLAQASELYEEAQQALIEGDFGLYGQKIEELGQILQKN